MTDEVIVANFPDSGSRARVAYEMTRYMVKLLPETKNNDDRIDDILNLYVRCWEATNGIRPAKR